MNLEMLSQWENIIGQEKVKIITDRFFGNKLQSEFPNLEKNDYTSRKSNILSELESTGNILIEFEKSGFLTHDEVMSLIEITARELIIKNTPSAMFNSLSVMLDEENEGEDEWLDRELKHIEQILDSFKFQKKSYE